MKIVRNENERGSILIITLLTLLAITAIGAGVMVLASTDVEIAGNVRAGEQALYYADAGLGIALAGIDFNGGTAIPPAGAPQVLYPSGGGYAPVKAPDGSTIPNAQFQVTGEMNVNNNGYAVVCNLPGYSVDYGQRTFHFVSTGISASGTSRQVEAIVKSQPTAGICPPGMGQLYSN